MKLDIPESELAKIKRLMDLRGKLLRVTIEAVRQRVPVMEWGDDDDTDADGDTG